MLSGEVGRVFPYLAISLPMLHSRWEAHPSWRVRLCNLSVANLFLLVFLGSCEVAVILLTGVESLGLQRRETWGTGLLW